MILLVAAITLLTGHLVVVLHTYWRVRALQARVSRIELVLKAPMSLLAKGELKPLDQALRRQELNPDLHKNRFDLN